MKQRVRMALTLVGSIAALSIFMIAFQFIQSSGIATGQSTPATTGLKLNISGVSINGNSQPEVSFKLTDSKGSPLRLADLDANSLRFDIVVLKQEAGTGRTYWESLITTPAKGSNFTLYGKQMTPAVESTDRPTTDSGGVFSDKGGGAFLYTFKTALPQGYSRTATYRVGSQATRDARAAVSNAVFDFVPAGGAKAEREIATTDACNRCHDPLAIHGGTRREVAYCVTCHNPQNVDTQSGTSLDLRVMVHKIHSGANLPSVKAGNIFFLANQSHDFSGVLFPQDVRNCTTCHNGKQGDVWKTQPSAAACGACHDDVNFQTGANHGGGAQPDTACKTCHPADGQEFDLSVSGAHTIPEKSAQLRGVNFEIVSFTNTKPGQSPTVVFSIKDKAGQPIKPAEMASLSLVLAGPTSDYASAVSESATGATATADGNNSYTFKAQIPADARGTYAVGIQGYLSKTLKGAAVRDVGFNKIAYGAVTDAQPLPRKQVVDLDKCNSCHETLALHGGSRRNTQFCVFCHNPNGSDAEKRASVGGPQPPSSINFDWLIHKIHTGEEQNEKLVIYGGGAGNVRPVDLSEVRFPGDRRNCEKCHVAGSQLLSFVRAGAQPQTVKVGGTVVSSIPPISAACTGCHDSGPAKTHATAQTVNGAESCVVCHNEGRDFAVSTAHAR